MGGLRPCSALPLTPSSGKVSQMTPAPQQRSPPASLSPVAHCPELQNLLYKFYLPLLEGLGARSAHG